MPAYRRLGRTVLDCATSGPVKDSQCGILDDLGLFGGYAWYWFDLHRIIRSDQIVLAPVCDAGSDFYDSWCDWAVYGVDAEGDRAVEGERRILKQTHALFLA
jgi:hypothetical protein